MVVGNSFGRRRGGGGRRRGGRRRDGRRRGGGGAGGNCGSGCNPPSSGSGGSGDGSRKLEALNLKTQKVRALKPSSPVELGPKTQKAWKESSTRSMTSAVAESGSRASLGFQAQGLELGLGVGFRAEAFEVLPTVTHWRFSPYNQNLLEASRKVLTFTLHITLASHVGFTCGCRVFFFVFLTLLFRLLSLAQEGQGWLKEGTVAHARQKKGDASPHWQTGDGHTMHRAVSQPITTAHIHGHSNKPG